MNQPQLVEPSAPLTPERLARYSRHLSLPGVGELGQRRIANARVLLIGAGGLGSPIASYLIAAGVGKLTVLDDDTVETSNLQRQIVHRSTDVGQPKVNSVTRLAATLNEDVRVHPLAHRLNQNNALKLFRDHDLAIDGSDNFATRYLANDAAELTGTPLIWGTVFQFSGQVSVFDPRSGPMLRDLFPEIPDVDSVPSCAEGGVFGALCGIVGSTMAVEALKLITGVGQVLSGKLWLYDALEASTKIMNFAVDPHREPVLALAETTGDSCALTQQVSTLHPHQLEELRAARSVLVVDVREPWERQIAAIHGSLHVPFQDIAERGWDAIAHQRHGEVVLVCKSGVRSARAATVLTRSPHDVPEGLALHNLEGGTVGWFAAIHGEALTY